jgi:hypothetical protein
MGRLLLATPALAQPVGRTVEISSGYQDGYYESVARLLRATLLMELELPLELSQSAGSVENLSRLDEPSSLTAIALTQADALADDSSVHPESEEKYVVLGELGDECAFLITTAKGAPTSLTDLHGGAMGGIAVGDVRSGATVTWRHLTQPDPRLAETAAEPISVIEAMLDLNASQRRKPVAATLLVQRPRAISAPIEMVMNNRECFRFVPIHAADIALPEEMSREQAGYRFKEVSLAIGSDQTIKVETLCTRGLVLTEKHKLGEARLRDITRALCNASSTVFPRSNQRGGGRCQGRACRAPSPRESGILREGTGILSDRILQVLGEDLERNPLGKLRHARHPERHRAGGIDYPGIIGILEPERHHVVLFVRGAHDDRTIDLGVGKAQVAQGVEGEELEPIAIVATSRQRLFQRGPMIDGAVLAVVSLRLRLDPVGDLSRERSTALRAEIEILHAQTVLSELVVGQTRVRARGARRVDGGAALEGLEERSVEALAPLPSADLRTPDVIGSGGLEVVESGDWDLAQPSRCTAHSRQQEDHRKQEGHAPLPLCMERHASAIGLADWEIEGTPGLAVGGLESMRQRTRIGAPSCAMAAPALRAKC